MTDPDVLVVGAGPAGSTVAGILAGAGRHVLLVDRARFPRPKPCGECLNPGGVAALRRLGLLDAVEVLKPARLDGWRLRSAGVDVAARFGSPDHGFGVSREILDDALLREAGRRGAQVLEETRVEDVAAAVGGGRPTATLRDPEGAHRTLRPRVVVGADGLRSVVSRSLGLVRRGPRLRKMSLTFHLRGDPPPPLEGASGAREGLLDTRDGVTLGIAPITTDHTRWNATVVADADRYGRRVGADPEAFFRQVMAERTPGGLVAWRVEGGPWASGPFDWPVARRWAPGAILVGDAAGYYDPFTGQGIYRALRSAEMAAEAVAEVLAAPTPSWTSLTAYDAAWRRDTRAPVWVQRGVEAVMSREAVCRPVLRRLAASGGLSRVIRVTGDIAAPVSLLDPRVWLG